MPAILLLLAACFDPPAPEVREAPPNTQQVKADLPMRPPGGAPDGVVNNIAPRITRVQIEPAQAGTLDDLRAVAEAADTDTPSVDIDFVWVINGTERPDLADETLSHEEFRKGDKIAVKAVASDGDNEVERTSAEQVIVNSPPAFTGDPRVAGQINGLTLRAEDPDDDPVQFSLGGAPAGMQIDPKMGRITYQGSEEEPGGDYTVVVKVDDGDGGEARWEFGLSVSPGSKAVEAAKKAAEEAAAAGG